MRLSCDRGGTRDTRDWGLELVCLPLTDDRTD